MARIYFIISGLILAIAGAWFGWNIYKVGKERKGDMEQVERALEMFIREFQGLALKGHRLPSTDEEMNQLFGHERQLNERLSWEFVEESQSVLFRAYGDGFFYRNFYEPIEMDFEINILIN